MHLRRWFDIPMFMNYSSHPKYLSNNCRKMNIHHMRLFAASKLNHGMRWFRNAASLFHAVKLYPVLIVLCAVISTAGAQTRYSRIAVQLSPSVTLRTLAALGLDLEGAVKRNGKLELFVSEDERRLLGVNAIACDVLIEDWNAYFNARNDQMRKTAVMPVSDVAHFHLGSMAGYLTNDEVAAELALMRAAFPALISEPDTIGYSIQQRPMLAVKISSQAAQQRDLPRALVTALHHAREPEGLMATVYFMWYLLENYGVDEEVTGLLDHRELYFVPVVNPDGYAFNQQDQPLGGGMWRKNRRPFANNVFGVDINRNYGAHWGYDEVGSSADSTREAYRGPAPFSEPETRAIRDLSIREHFSIALNYHTYGSDLIFPIGYIDEESPDSLYYRMIAEDMTAVNRYAFGTGTQTVLYPTNGDSDDWLYCDSISKPKTIAMSSEIGDEKDGFWPGSGRIASIARFNLPMNLYLVHAAGVFLTFDTVRVDPPYPKDSLRITLPFLDKGLRGYDGAVNLTLRCPSGAATLIDSVFTTLPARGAPLVVRGSINPKKGKCGDRVLIAAELRYPDGLTRDSIVFRIGPALTLLADSAETPNQLWTFAGGWGRTNSSAHTGAWSYTDSPDANYPYYANSSMKLSSPISLKTAAAAELHFWTKWRIETNEDAATVKVSTNAGASWSNVGGRYAAYASSDGVQAPEYSPCYQGYRDRWVHEVIDLTPFVGSNDFLLRFGLMSDQNTEADGFYADDIHIYTFASGLAETTTPGTPGNFMLWQNAPNPFRDRTEVFCTLAAQCRLNVSVYDMLGERIAVLADGGFNPGTLALHWTAGSAQGLYLCRMTAVPLDHPEQVFTATKKLVVVK